MCIILILLDSKQDTFIEIFWFVINEFYGTDTIKIENKNQLISIRFPVAYSYLHVLRRFDKYSWQIDIDCKVGITYIEFETSNSI